MKRLFITNTYSRSALPVPGSPVISPAHFPIRARSGFQGSIFSTGFGDSAPSNPRARPQPNGKIRTFRIVVFIASYVIGVTASEIVQIGHQNATFGNVKSSLG